MRGLLRGFADRGGTVLLSSHLLHEVEAVADQLVVIAGGRIAARGSKAELLTSAGTVVRATDRAALQAALGAAGIPTAPGRDGALVADAEPEAVGRAAAADAVVLVELRPADGGGLEELFRSLTGSSDTPPAGTVPVAPQVQEARA
jgi:ABC-2 type transport system ATP-binding protein